MKRFPPPDGEYGLTLRTRMVLLFMAASLGILGITAINLFLAKGGMNGGRASILIPILAALVSIGLIAFFSYLVTTSISRPLRSILEFTRSISAGRLDERLSVTGSGEAVSLAAALNTMAENIESRVAKIASSGGSLAACDKNIEEAVRQVCDSSRLQESSVERATSMVENIGDSLRDISAGIEKFSSSASATASSTFEMAATIKEVATSADRLGDSVAEVSSSIMEMAASTREIGTSIVNLMDASSETASSIAQLDFTIKQVEKNALGAALITEAVKNDAETGKRAVEEAIAGMQAIRKSSRITAEVVENLSLRAKDIGVILSVIDEVAEQTSLLAFNATIIAAQAGEHGKGFAVVADEIRELAERTSSSTREIATVIRGVQDETSRAVDAIDQAEVSISAGEKLSQRSGDALEKIVGGVQQASIQVHEIARATVEQAHGSQSIKEAMQSVADMVEHIANSAGEHTKTSELISAAVERMKDLTIHVRNSTRELSHTTGLIAHATEEVLGMTEQIREAGSSRFADSEAIAAMLGEIRAATASGSGAAKLMTDSLASLSEQIAHLENGLASFKIQT